MVNVKKLSTESLCNLYKSKCNRHLYSVKHITPAFLKNRRIKNYLADTIALDFIVVVVNFIQKADRIFLLPLKLITKNTYEQTRRNCCMYNRRNQIRVNKDKKLCRNKFSCLQVFSAENGTDIIEINLR